MYVGLHTVDTLIDPNKKLEELEDSCLVNKGRHQRLVEKLIYLSHTRPNIAFAVSFVIQFMHSPREVYMR